MSTSRRTPQRLAREDARNEGQPTASTPAEALRQMDTVEVRLLECRALLARLEEQLNITFGDLAITLAAGEKLARQAFRAISLLQQGALLEPTSVETVLSPKSVIARHRTAVARGAAQILPELTSAEDLNLAVRLAVRFGREMHVDNANPQCEAVARNTGLRCKKRAMSVGRDEFSTRCYSHSNKDVRQRCQRHRMVANSESGVIGKGGKNIEQAVVKQWIESHYPLSDLSIVPTDWPLFSPPEDGNRASPSESLTSGAPTRGSAQS